MKNKYFAVLILVWCSLRSQNKLFIPDTISGTSFNLTIQTGAKIFYTGYNTPTWGINGNFLAPTLIMKKGDNININLTNNLTVSTTMHWHGFHIPAIYDGGPHQVIKKNTTWNPQFKILNDAGTFWYHPHGDGTTELHVTKGLAGMIIVRDSAEATYSLPRKYGVDDFPLIVQSKSFDVLYQLAAFTEYDTVMMVNGTIDPFLQVPKQVVRLRLLNGSSERSYYFGLEDNSAFNLIATDGGLLPKPEPMNRIRLSPGERVEILVNFSGYNQGQSIYLKSYASELPNGIVGADSVGDQTHSMPDYYNNPLNGADFNVLRLDVIASTSNPVTTIPAVFTPLTPFIESEAKKARTIHFSPDTSIGGAGAVVEGPFFMNGKSFHMDSINEVVYLNDIEIWQLTNATMVAHPFHIHDIEFYVLDINGNPPPVFLSGKKDVILVHPNDTVRFITKFDDFANDTVPYMYHCHLLHHEDEGMMGSFIVTDTTASVGTSNSTTQSAHIRIFPNPSSNDLKFYFEDNRSKIIAIALTDITGKEIYRDKLNCDSVCVYELSVSEYSNGVYFIKAFTTDRFYVKKIVVNHE